MKIEQKKIIYLRCHIKTKGKSDNIKAIMDDTRNINAHKIIFKGHLVLKWV